MILKEGQVISIDLGQVGPSSLGVIKIDHFNKKVILEHIVSKKQIDLDFEVLEDFGYEFDKRDLLQE